MKELELIGKLSIGQLRRIASRIHEEYPGLSDFTYWFEFREQLIKILCTKSNHAIGTKKHYAEKPREFYHD